MNRLIVDVSNLCWTALFSGKDHEFSQEVEHEGKVVNVVGWQHGFENAIDWLTDVWDTLRIPPMSTIMVYETGNSTAIRKRILPTYKESRTSRPEEQYTQFQILRDKLIEAVQHLGGAAVTRPHLEADDVIAFLAKKLQGTKVIMSLDGDMAALLDKETYLWRRGELVSENIYGKWNPKHITVYKALVGDTSDKISGAKGFGQKAWEGLIETFGEESLGIIEELILTKTLDKLEDNAQEFKPLQRVIDNANDVYVSYDAAKFYPEMCENMRQPLQWFAGYVRDTSEIEDDRLLTFAGSTLLVTQKNFEDALELLASEVKVSEWVALDLETTTTPESDEWCEEAGVVVDVHNSRITGMGLTFGDNQQYNLYFSVEHKDTDNISIDQLRQVIETIPADKEKVIANFAGFEALVLRNTFGDLQGSFFLPNVTDVQLEASYVNENIRRGLKNLSKHYLDADQVEYKEVTQGRKMHQLTGEEVLSYGADDTLFTSALHNHFLRIMEIEDTADSFKINENDCQYTVAFAQLHGVDFDFGKLLEIEREDVEKEVELRKVLDEFLIAQEWEGTVCPTFTSEDMETPAKIKEFYKIVTGEIFETRMRRIDKIATFIESQDHEDAAMIADIVARGDFESANTLMQSRFEGAPVLNTGSPKQMQTFLYKTCGLPIRLLNNLTDLERKDPRLAQAFWQHGDLQKEKAGTPRLSDKQIELLLKKATTDKAAINFAMKFDVGDKPEVEKALKAFQALSAIATRKSLFYEPWKNLLYWQDRKLYPSFLQSSTTTLRFSSSKPNLQQVSRRGEGVKLRSTFIPHRKDALIVSLDLSGQELRIQADQSQDPDFLACYIGEHKKDVHGLTAASILGVSYEEYDKVVHSDDPRRSEYLQVRNDKAKGTNFLSSYSGTEYALHKDMVTSLKEARTFLDAKRKAFPRYEDWQAEVQEFARTNGYVVALGGTRRHVASTMTRGEKWEINAASRSAGNYMVQSAAATEMKRAMGKLWRSGAFQKWDVRMLATIHDEVVLSIPYENVLEVAEFVFSVMTEQFYNTVPSVSSVSIGENFRDLTEFEGDTFDEMREDIQEFMKQYAPTNKAH